MGLNQWLVKVSWLGELVSVFLQVELGLFSLEYNEDSSGEFWGVYELGMALGTCLLMSGVVFLFCWRISVMCLALGLVALGWSLVSV